LQHSSKTYGVRESAPQKVWSRETQRGMEVRTKFQTSFGSVTTLVTPPHVGLILYVTPQRSEYMWGSFKRERKLPAKEGPPPTS